MTDAGTPDNERELVTIDITDADVYAVLVNALRQSANDAKDNAERASEEDEPSADWAEDQEHAAQIALDLVQSIEEQMDANSLARIEARNAESNGES